MLAAIYARVASERQERRQTIDSQLTALRAWAAANGHFLQHPISDDPNDQLLLQIQGAIAEYERAVLGARFRRGKRPKARAGQFLGGRAPYGHRYVPRRDGVPGPLVVDEAEVVRLLYGWLIDERMTIRRILKRLNFGPWFPRSGRRPWSPSTAHHILADPVHAGTADANRDADVPARKPRRCGPRTATNTRRRLRPREEWIAIPVPALVDQGPVRAGPDGTAPRPSWRATPNSPSAATPGTTTCCAAC